MKDFHDFYILGLPIETPVGDCKFLKVKDYPEYYYHLHVLSMSKGYVIHNFNGSPEEKKLLQDSSMFEIVMSFKDLSEAYIELFAKVFEADKIKAPINNSEIFDYCRSLIMKMNCVKEKKINPNPEIQRWIEKSKRVREQNGEKLTFSDIVSSVVVGSGISYEDINNMTIYQLYSTFHRISNFKNFDATTLFRTVTNEIEVKSWDEHIDLFKEEDFGLTKEEFNQKIGKVVNE